MKLTKSQVLSLSEQRFQLVRKNITIYETKNICIVVHFPNGSTVQDPIASGSCIFPEFYVRAGAEEFCVLVSVHNPLISTTYASQRFMQPVTPTRMSFQLELKGMPPSYKPALICNTISDFLGYFYFGDRYVAKK